MRGVLAIQGVLVVAVEALVRLVQIMRLVQELLIPSREYLLLMPLEAELELMQLELMDEGVEVADQCLLVQYLPAARVVAALSLSDTYLLHNASLEINPKPTRGTT